MVARKLKCRHDRLAGYSQAGDAILGGKRDQNIRKHGMDMEVQMAVDMVQVADEFQMQFDLRPAFGLERRAKPAIEEVTHPGKHRVVGEAARRVHYAAEFGRGKNTHTPARHDVQAHVEAQLLAGGIRCGIARRRRHYQARAAKHAVTMGADDTLIDFGRQPEIVPIDDYRFQLILGAFSMPAMTLAFPLLRLPQPRACANSSSDDTRRPRNFACNCATAQAPSLCS